MVVDGVGRIIDCAIGFPGSYHDGRMFKMSSLKTRIEQGTILNGNSIVFNNILIPQLIIADKAYACLPQVIPNYIRRWNLGSYERRKRSHFNKILRRHRAIVENVIGSLKMGFQILK